LYPIPRFCIFWHQGEENMYGFVVSLMCCLLVGGTHPLSGMPTRLSAEKQKKTVCPYPIVGRPKIFPKCSRVKRSFYLKNYETTSLYDLTHSEIIVVGRVEGVVRYGYSPVGSKGPDQYTVYAFQVEETLKGPHLPWRKIFQFGGPLPWKKDRESGIGYKEHNSTFLISGNRYVLFLRDAAKYNWKMAVDGFDESGQQVDEFACTDEFLSRFLIKEDRVVSSDIEDKRRLIFPGPMRAHMQVEGKSVSEVLEILRNMIAAPEDPYKNP
jgi:hypothetical protein